MHLVDDRRGSCVKEYNQQEKQKPLDHMKAIESLFLRKNHLNQYDWETYLIVGTSPGIAKANVSSNSTVNESPSLAIKNKEVPSYITFKSSKTDAKILSKYSSLTRDSSLKSAKFGRVLVSSTLNLTEKDGISRLYTSTSTVNFGEKIVSVQIEKYLTETVFNKFLSHLAGSAPSRYRS